MTGPDWFIVGVRLLGMWLLARAAEYGIGFLDVRIVPSPMREPAPPYSYLLFGAADMGLALIFLLGAEHLAGILYGLNRPTSAEEDNENISRDTGDGVERGD